MVQCKSMGIWDKWEHVLDMYRDVNQLFGDIVKVHAGKMAYFALTTSGSAGEDPTPPNTAYCIC